jgi:hypothetical protein
VNYTGCEEEKITQNKNIINKKEFIKVLLKVLQSGE